MATTSAVLRILVDLTHLYPGGVSGGIKPALHAILNWLGQQPDTNVEFVFLTDPLLDQEISRWLRPVDRLVSMHQAPPDLAARENCHLVYCPFGMTDRACPGIPTVTLIVDLLHRDFPESLPWQYRSLREEYFRTAMERTDLFQVISDYTAGQLRKHYGVEPDRIIRTHLPVHGRLPSPLPASRKSSVAPYFFYPANAWAHKNHETLLLAYSLYRRAAGAAAWRLVLTGHMDAPMHHLQSVAASLGLSAEIDFLGYVDESRLATLWDEASALIFPSLHEGFGIPLLEAMARGVPILAGNSTVISEITGDAALLVDSRAPLALAEGMHQLVGSPPLRSSLVERGRRRAADFSPEVEFGRLLDAFYSTANRPSIWRRTGYHLIDGLTDPLAIFALPLSSGPQKLSYATRPLGVTRQLEFCCGPGCLERITVAANVLTEGFILVSAGAQVLTLRVPDAARLTPTDPRTHGVWLERLQVQHADGRVTDLLPPPGS
jgi:glycosyltransferase involved in cell wall biosynthesis